MIKPKTYTEKRLAELLGARHLSVTQVVKTILNTYIGRPCNDTQKNLMMEHILENISLFRHNTEIMSLVRQVEFVISGNGYIRKPNELFDPADHDLVQMFNDSGKFPHNENRTYLNILKTFGLKSSSDLKAADINNVAIFIHRKASLAQNESFKIIAGQANGLLNILMKNQHLFELNISNKTLKDVLADLKIIQPLRKPQSYPEVLQWFASPYMFCKPNLPIEFIEKLNPKCRSIPIAKVFEQLLLLEKSYNEMLKPEYHYIVKQIYSFLNRTTTATAVICSMKNRSVVWTGHGFCKPQNIYLNSSNDDIYLEPYLYQLPDEFLYMKEFFQQLGCQECQSPQLLVDVQEQIKQNHVQVRTEKEYRRDLRHIINILNFFKSHFHDKIVYKVLIPVETDVKYQLLFKYIDECAYRNSHWSEDVNVLDKEEPFCRPSGNNFCL
ncbi:SACS [Mytilus edulis]|uniref:SACS n=1 Tax=Mytilus edulis TaxID=6550 RepID=A0A8S3U6U9_MYTED|nr:SACS [Mytilus edulis]